jgi:hypothetical protein
MVRFDDSVIGKGIDLQGLLTRASPLLARAAL